MISYRWPNASTRGGNPILHLQTETITGGFTYILDGWSGRLCNNLIQVTDGIYLAKRDSGIFQQKLKHSIIKQFAVKFNKDPLPKKLLEKKLDICPYNESRSILKTYVLPNCRFPELTPTDTLVIHMRGGDILRKSPPPHAGYVQPPLSFYKRVIEDCPVKDIIILTEEVPNPCAKIIQSIYPNCIIQTSTVINDVSTFLKATHVCFNSAGTFGRILASMSPNVKMAYTAVYLDTNLNWPTDINVKSYLFSDYIQPGQWTASDEQIKQMLDS